jgi:LysR family nitrogen assimilation transcriptional regulator
MNLNLTHLLNFIQVAERGNVSKAAAYLNIAQPALSRQIQALESLLDTALLQRSNAGVEPTEDGKLFLEHARRIQKECASAIQSVRSNRENPSGSIYLGVPSAYSVSLVPPLIQEMRRRYPNITVHIVEGFSRAIYEWLLSGRLDLAILYQSKAHHVPGSSPFLVEDMVALTAPKMFDDVSRMSLAELADRQVIAPWQPHFLRQALDGIFLDLGVSFVPRLEIDSMRCMIEMAQLGDGTVILPRSCVARELAEGRLKAIAIDPSFKLATAIGQTPGRQQTRAVGVLTERLYRLAAELAPEKGWSVATAGADGERRQRR